MKIYGWAISHEYGNTTLAHTSPEGALAQCATWCKENWTGPGSYPEDGTDREIIDEYAEAHDQEQLDEFEAELDLSITALREAYCLAINAGLTQALDRGDEEWLDDQMQVLNDSLPKDWYVYSRAELAEVGSEYVPLPAYLKGIDDFPHLPGGNDVPTDL